MTTPHHRDETTGEIVINGRMGAFRAWARWFQPILVSVTSGIVLAVALASGAQLLQHHDQHKRQMDLNERVEEFMSAGTRFSSSPDYPGINDVSALITLTRLETHEELSTNAPPQWLRDRIEKLEQTVNENQQDIKELLRLVR